MVVREKDRVWVCDVYEPDELAFQKETVILGRYDIGRKYVSSTADTKVSCSTEVEEGRRRVS